MQGVVAGRGTVGSAGGGLGGATRLRPGGRGEAESGDDGKTSSNHGRCSFRRDPGVRPFRRSACYLFLKECGDRQIWRPRSVVPHHPGPLLPASPPDLTGEEGERSLERAV